MYYYFQNKTPDYDERDNKNAAMGMFVGASLAGSLRKELVMATLRKRRDNWYARVQWRDKNGTMKEKQIPLRTHSKVTAHARLSSVVNVESDIKDGMSFTFPWMSKNRHTQVAVLTVGAAVEQWLNHRRKNKIRKSTLELNELGLKYLLKLVGKKRPLQSISSSDICNYVDLLDAKGLADTTINIHLRTIKAMMRFYHKMGKVQKVPVIDQRQVARTDPIYITDDEFQQIMELEYLDDFYKRVFFFYRETGVRLREPFMATLSGDWLDIPPESKTKAMRSIEMNPLLIEVFIELDAWYSTGYGATLADCGEHLSKVFKKALRHIGADENKRFHSLRHTFAVRKLLVHTPVYDVKLMMGHASVTTTEQYCKMNLKRAAQDFPTLVSIYLGAGELMKKDTFLKDTTKGVNGYLPIFENIEG